MASRLRIGSLRLLMSSTTVKQTGQLTSCFLNSRFFSMVHGQTVKGNTDTFCNKNLFSTMENLQLLTAWFKKNKTPFTLQYLTLASL